MVEDGEIVVTIQNSNAVGYYEGGNDVHQVRVSTKGEDWLSVAPSSGLLLNGDSMTVVVHTDATSLNAGQYSSLIYLQTNDPENSIVSVPVSLEVIGFPEISFSSQCLDFGELMQHTGTTMQLVIYNQSCADLEIEELLSSQPAYTFSFSQRSIPPGATDTLLVNFFTDTIGVLKIQ